MESNNIRNAGPAVGIMADSHGSLEAVEAAISMFHRQGCRWIFHLGDICDSQSSASSDACVQCLVRHKVKAILGNNDHIVTRTPPGNIEPYTLRYLEGLPLERGFRAGVMVHNRPDVARLGRSCLIGDIGAADLDGFVRDYSETILFRGHSHRPSVLPVQGAGSTAQPMVPGQEIRLDPRWKWVVTCGALEDGFCLTWHPDRMVLTAWQI